MSAEEVLRLYRRLLDRDPLAPADLGLEAFLRMAAQRDLQNWLRKERRYQQNRRDGNVVEQSAQEGKYLQREDDPALPLQSENEGAGNKEQR